MAQSWEQIHSEIQIDPLTLTEEKPWINTTNLLYYLRWNHFQSNLTKVFDQLLKSESFVDVTLACDGHSIKAHKVVLSACSPYFQSLFAQNPCQHPIVIMKDITWQQLKAIVEFMYKGEINVPQDQLGPLLMVAEMLKIRGLTEVTTEQEKPSAQKPIVVETPDKLPSNSESVNKEGLSKVKAQRKSSNSNSKTTEASSTFITANNQPIITTSSTTLHTLTNVPFVYTDVELKVNDEPPIKQPKLNSSSNSTTDFTPVRNNNKVITWTQDQLQEAIQAVVTQKMRFTQASNTYGIPKGTLYDNILGKTNRMLVLDEAGLSKEEEQTTLDFCCDVSVSPYNRRTKKSLTSVLKFVESLRRMRDPEFAFSGLAGFRWWWAFCKKHSIVSLYFDNEKKPGKVDYCNDVPE